SMDRPREGFHGHGLGEPRHAFDQQVALGEDRHQHALEKMVLPDDHLLHLVEDALHQEGMLGVSGFRVAHGFNVSNSQNGDMPIPAAAFSIGTAKPMPMNTRCSVGFMIPVTMPTTSPSAVTSGPPELPGLTAASNWMRFDKDLRPSGET